MGKYHNQSMAEVTNTPEELGGPPLAGLSSSPGQVSEPSGDPATYDHRQDIVIHHAPDGHESPDKRIDSSQARTEGTASINKPEQRPVSQQYCGIDRVEH
jgi:hypothetical protein